ncbi:MAG TPA: SpoIID/LytB domain-containing protein [Dictyoglomaceae bacterium]|nr:SpoIID/LytB domain-containing protein [Dictyoglomaceae bacterium]HOL39693.1 SpoIID/LytB domain-containing protein [Dictyoglomaceae bacterium]HPP16038.1 SpoIID/LytB domain-containing protein [Dictyoglomaceae bacterium]
MKKLLIFVFLFFSLINVVPSQDIPTLKIGLGRIEKEAVFSNVSRIITDYLDIKVEGKGSIKIKNIDGSVFIETANGILGVTLPLDLYPIDGEFINYNSKAYRGYLEINKDSWIINILNMEEYLFSVVPSEMPAFYPMEALKAQAVASRTYALVSRGRHGGFDLCNNTHCQVYKGVVAENERSNKAVLDTLGEIVVYNGSPIKAFFHSSSGGYTENSENVWGEYLPYLRAVKDVDELFLDTWTLNFSVDYFVDKLKAAHINLNNSFSIELEKTETGRVRRLLFKDDQYIYDMNGTTFRQLFNLPSTLFDILLNGNGILTLVGRGNGHGVGLSQKGAKVLAERGYNYKEILKYYYQKVEAAKWY